MKYFIDNSPARLMKLAVFNFLILTSLAISSNNVYATEITICHYPPGNVENVQIITIDDSAWAAHRDLHGDGDLADALADEEGNCPAAPVVSSCPALSGGGLVFSINAPLVQESTAVADALNTYSFESVDNWNSVFRAGTGITTIDWTGVGTYEGTGAKVDTPNRYGAADGVGHYLFIRNTEGLSIEDNPGVTLTFDTPVAYFGFWWSAGDYANLLKITLVDGREIDLETGLVWNSEGFIQETASNGGHMGNPTAPFLDQNSGEPYAYLNLTARDECSKIASVRFHGRNFETDNHTVTTALIDPPGTIIPTAPYFGSAGRFNVQEINKLKVNNGAGNGQVAP